MASRCSWRTARSAAADHFNYYQPWEGLQSGSLDDGPGYAGQINDTNTGLSYADQRYYDPHIPRFISMDPVGVDATTGANFNRYWYANDNPYRFTDPDGRDACKADSGGNVHCSPSPPPTTGCHTSGCSGSANVSVIQVGSPSKSDEQKMKAQANQSGGNSAGSSAGDASGSASGQSSAGSSQSEKITKEWTVQDFNELDGRATDSYAPLSLASVGLGAGSATVFVGGPIAWDAAAPYVRPLAMATCLGASFICHGASEELQELPHQFAEQKELMEKMYEGEAAEAVTWYRQVLESGQQ